MVNTDAKTRDKSLIIIFLFYCFAMSQYHQFLHALIHIQDIVHDNSKEIFGKKR